jgi:hypothetical protein
MIKGKFYILGVAGNGIFSSTIQAFSDSPLPVHDRWSHVAACFFNWSLNTWLVVESVFPIGVRLLSLDNWLSENWNKSIIQFTEYPWLQPSELLRHVGKGYSVRDIARLARSKATGVRIRTISDGGKKYCAELIADCDNGYITKLLKDESDELYPFHYQNVAAYPIYDLRSLIIDTSLASA